MLLEMKNRSAFDLYNCLQSFFIENNISLENLIGFASDNARVMMGSKGGVLHMLKQKNLDIFIQLCVCYSLHLCASKALNELPCYLEELARNIFSTSPKCLAEYKEFKKITNISPYKILIS